MIKRVIYLVMSGIVTTTAVLQLTPTDVQPVADTAEKRQAVRGAGEMLAAMDVDGTFADAEALKALATKPSPTKIRVRLVSPDTPPAPDEEKVPREETPDAMPIALEMLPETAQIKALRIPEGMTVVSAAMPQDAAMAQAKAAATVIDGPSGKRYAAMPNRELGLVHWICATDSDGRPAQSCAFSIHTATALPDIPLCPPQTSVMMTCRGQDVDTAALLPQCPQAQAELRGQAAAGDTIVAGDTTYRLEQHDLKGAFDGCVFSTLTPDVPQSQPVRVRDGLPHYAPSHVLLAVGAGAVMVLLGVVCTRRRKETDPLLAETRKSLDRSQKSLREAKLEAQHASDDLVSEKKKNAVLTAEADARSQEIHQLNEQLEHARSEFKKEQLIRMSLAEENHRLEDALQSASSHTIVDSPVRFAQTDNPKLHTESPAPPPAASQPATTTTKLPEMPKTESLLKSDSFFEGFSDDGWDEIANSFDSILSPGKSSEENQNVDAILDLDNEGEDVKSLGMTSFLNAIEKDEPRTTSRPTNHRIDTETRLKPVSEGPKLSAIPSISKPNTSVSALPGISSTGLRRTTLSGAGGQAVPTPSSPELAIKSNKDPESFRPAPSWTGKTVTENGLDPNSLYDALKRRARDVSELNLPAALDASGSVEFSRGLSKSGVFSLTGSRVDIDPLSDNEYFKLLYEQYTTLQQECGEETGKFTLEQFVSKLAHQKEQLIKTYKCKNVRFSVYKKDGKASLKATPQK